MLKLKRVVAVAMLMAVTVTATAQDLRTVLGTVVGGAIGGAAGSRVGQGNGRTAAIVGGTLLGAYAGNQMTSNSQPVEQTRTYQQSSYQPVRQTSQPVMSSRDAQRSYDNNEVITDDRYNSYERPAPRRVVRQVRDDQPRQRYEKFYYNVQSESGRTIQMVGCAAYDEREGASRQVDLRQCDGQQTAYQNY